MMLLVLFIVLNVFLNINSSAQMKTYNQMYAACNAI